MILCGGIQMIALIDSVLDLIFLCLSTFLILFYFKLEVKHLFDHGKIICKDHQFPVTIYLQKKV